MMDAKTTHSIDLYPSRKGLPARFIERQDPVVYHDSAQKNVYLDASQVEQYKTQGYVIIEGLFRPEEIKALQDEMQRLRKTAAEDTQTTTISEPGEKQIRSVFSIHSNNKMFSALSKDSRLAGLAQYLLNDEVYVHQSRLNYKLGFRGKEFYWHSDFETWHVEDGMPRMRALSMSLLLSESSEHNGPLLLVPGSHTRFLSCEDETPENHYQASLKRQEYGVPSDKALTELVEAGGVVSATGKPGTLVIFDCNTMHGSNGNITPYPRSSLFYVFNAMSNQVGQPFCDQAVRPEYICTRESITAIELASS